MEQAHALTFDAFRLEPPPGAARRGWPKGSLRCGWGA